MDDRDDWLEGVRRWYFGGDAPAEAAEDELVWPSGNTAGGTGGAHREVPAPPAQARSAAASTP
ncbi:MAG TPA: hypothetical protein VLA16_05840 [Ideonella sp.]|nr:hypothetical protein [Ideonella sp.]